MKKTSIVISLAIVLISCVGKKKNSEDTHNFNGKIKLIIEKSFKGRLDGDSFRKNSIQKIVESKFEEDGRLIEEVTKNSRDFIIKTQKNSYDANGNLVSKEFFKGNGNLDYKVVFEYDNKSRCIKKTGHYGDGFIGGHTILRYNEQNNVIEEETVPGKPSYAGDFSRVLDKLLTKYSYDKSGNVATILILKNGGEQALVSTFEYNTDNKKTRESKINERGDTVYVATFSYDSRRELLEEVWDYSDKQRTYRIDYKNVKFDDKNNLLIKYSSKKFAYGTYDYLTERVDDKREDIMVEREITYY